MSSSGSARTIDARSGAGAVEPVLNLPNLLTGLRLLLAPALPLVLLVWGDLYLAGVLFALGAVTDFLDGFLARRLPGGVTDFGRHLDPAADKAFLACALSALVIVVQFPYWAFVVLALRDLVVLVGIEITIRRRLVGMWGARWPGKLVFVAEIAAVVAWVLAVPGRMVILVLALAGAVASLAWDGIRFRRACRAGAGQ